MSTFEITRHIVGTAIIALLGLSVVACKEKNKFTEPDIRSVQINTLKLSAHSVPELSNTFFSIDHRNGVIYNAKPLKRNTVLDSVALSVQTYEYNDIAVRLDGKEVPKSAKDSIYMRDHKKGLDIVISNKKFSMSKTYRLVINVYEQDPLASSWISQNTAPEKNAHEEGINYQTLTTEEGYYYMYSTQTACNIYFAAQASPEKWTPFATIPFFVKRIAQITEGRLVLQSATDKLYEISASSSAKDCGISVVSLLGAVEPTPSETGNLAIIIQDNGKLHFATVNLTRSTPSITKGEMVPDDFPIQESALFISEVEHRKQLNLLGGKDKKGHNQKKLWATTTGLDWLSPHQVEISTLPDFASTGVIAFDSSRKTAFLLFCGDKTQATGKLRIFVSSDRGVRWTEAQAKDLLPQEITGQNFGKGLSFYVSPDSKLFLFGGHINTPAENNKIWIGTPTVR
ncbi:MAG: DUF6242 domain-containing protein [Porphyromonas sp.]|nr:DUF6242 domain-containing protein [Porphyromonas sp.]